MARGDFPSAKQDQFVLRFPDGMREKIKRAAAENGRSMNAEIIHRLQTTLEMDAYVPKENANPDVVHDKEELIAIVRAEVERMNSVLNTLIQDAADPNSPINKRAKNT